MVRLDGWVTAGLRRGRRGEGGEERAARRGLLKEVEWIIWRSNPATARPERADQLPMVLD